MVATTALTPKRVASGANASAIITAEQLGLVTMNPRWVSRHASSRPRWSGLTSGMISGTGSLDVGGFGAADAANFGQKQFNISGTGPAGGIGALTNSSTANGQINAFQKVTLTADATVQEAYMGRPRSLS